MSSAAKVVRPNPRPSRSQSHTVSTGHAHKKSLTSTTPHTALPLTNFASTGNSHSHSRSKGSSTPNYFTLIVEESKQSSGTDNHNDLDKGSWLPSGSTARSIPQKTPDYVPLNEQPEYEEFRRQAENHTFSHDGLSRSFNMPSSNSIKAVAGKCVQRPPTLHRISDSDSMEVDPLDNSGSSSSDDSGKQANYGVPLTKSPANMPAGVPQYLQDERLSRLSLPHDDVAGPSNSSMESLNNNLRRASTLPSASSDEAQLLSPVHVEEVLQANADKTLILDFRTAALYSQAHLKDALNLCIPTTLLKRPSFGIQKLIDAFKTESDKALFERWRQCTHIIAYDAKSGNPKEADLLVHALKKFTREGFTGQGIVIKGGFTDFARANPQRVEVGSASSSSSSRSSSVDSHLPAVAQVAGGCPMPATQNAANPFFSNIRQNMDLIGGVGQIPVSRPTGLSSAVESKLPRWMRIATSEKDRGKIIADRFLQIELAEKSRMESALSTQVRYGDCTSGVSTPGQEIRLAGLEKGPKNRYNNIWPYDHTRVKLQHHDTDSCDYINASHVGSRLSSKRFIACQAPIPATFDDFWNSVWEQDVRVILMLTAEQEGGQVKAHQYWKGKQFGQMKLKALGERRVAVETASTSKSKHGSGSSDDDEDNRPYLVARKFALTHANQPFSPMREITQLHFSAWPDFGTPAHPSQLLSIMRHTDRFARHSSLLENGMPRPVLVHCSAGCGRTGVFVTVDSVIDRLRHLRSESWMGSTSEDDLVRDVVEELRGQRLSMVQSLRQYVLCYETVLEWMVEKIHDA